jgi:hypothetical protein
MATMWRQSGPGVALLGAVLIAAALPARPGAAAETALALAGGIAATLNLPEGAAQPAPAVLMLHGFGSAKDEVGGMFARAAAALAERGIASLRIDFRGFGKSDGDTGAATLDGMLADARVALDALRAMEGIDPARLGLLGFSLGGGVAMLLAAEEKGGLRSLVTWSSVGDPDADFRALLGDATFARARAEGIVGLDLGWRTMALKAGFFDSLAGRDLKAAVAAYPVAFLAVVGDQDSLAAYGEGFLAAAGGSDKALAVIPGGDHIFHVLGPDQGLADDVIRRTAERFAATL